MQKRREDEEEESGYQMTVREREKPGHLKIKNWTLMSEELAVGRIWICRKAEYVMMMMMTTAVFLHS